MSLKLNVFDQGVTVTLRFNMIKVILLTSMLDNIQCLYIVLNFYCRFRVSVSACYTYPTTVCSQATTGTVNVLSNTCPVYTGVTETTISSNLQDNARALALFVQDPDPQHFGQISYQIVGDTASVRDFYIDSQV